jgi:8-oxo-dGTP pyrophosphatase MutT (NUDIX family)
MKVVDKAFAYVTHRARVLVFEHALFPEAGVQVPAGTVMIGEPPAVAVLREVREETGLSNFVETAYLGAVDFDARAIGKDELHRRHFFHLPLLGEVPERWRHYERAAADGSGPLAFDLYWLLLEVAAARLAHGHGALLVEVHGRLSRA